MTQDTITKITNYQGNNSFLIKMKESFQKYGNLTPNQLTAVENILGKPAPKSFEELPEEVKEIALYNGNNKFLIDIKTKLIEKRSLTEKQIEVAIRQNRQEKDKNKKARTEKEQKQIATTEIRNAINALKRLVKAGVITKQQFEQQKTALTNLKKK